MTFRDSVLRTANGDDESIISRLKFPEKSYIPEEYRDKEAEEAEAYSAIKLLNATLGLVGESGEFADMVKKSIMHGRMFDRDKAILELGDIRYYLELATVALGTTMEFVEQKNIEKLTKRYPNGFTTEDSIKRADEDDTPLSGAV